jgi:hypothetical protein
MKLGFSHEDRNGSNVDWYTPPWVFQRLGHLVHNVGVSGGAATPIAQVPDKSVEQDAARPAGMIC